MVAYATLAAGRDASSLLDAALAAATAVTDPAMRDRLLGWGAVELRTYDVSSPPPPQLPRARLQARARRARCRSPRGSRRPRRSSHRARRAAADVGTPHRRRVLARLPALDRQRSCSGVRSSSPEGCGVTVCAHVRRAGRGADLEGHRGVAAESRVPRARAGLGADRRSDRAMLAASRMPGTERADVIVDVLDGVADTKTLDLAHVAALANKAIAAAATRAKPLVLTDPSTDRAELNDFIGQAALGEVVAALARRYIARGDLASAKAAVDAIPTNLSSHHEAALQLGCARKAKGEVTLDAIVAALPAAYDANLAEAAAQVGCVDVMKAILGRASYGERIAENVAWSTLASGRLDAALALLRAIDVLDATRVASLHADLAFALARAGRATDGARGAPRHRGAAVQDVRAARARRGLPRGRHARRCR